MSTSLEKIKNSKVRKAQKQFSAKADHCLKLLSVGEYLLIEERTSMLYSQDQRSLSNVGRLGRIGIVKNINNSNMLSRVLPFLR